MPADRDRLTAEVAEVVHRETRAWDTQDVDLLLGIFHPDMVWVWPPTAADHDPVAWESPLGRFDRERWGRVYRDLFAAHRPTRNERTIRRIEVSAEGDGAFAVVDVDTVWERRDGNGAMRWRGRACKVYARVGDAWKQVAHTGLLDYGAP